MINEPATPEAKHLTTLVTDQPVQILVGPQSSGRWHRCLNDLHDTGIIPSLSDAGLRVLTAFLRLNDAPTGSLNPATGLVYADVPRLMAVTRRGRSLVFKGRAELAKWRPPRAADPRRLVTEEGRDWYAVLPGWEWATRPATSPQVRIPPSAPADKSSAIADAACAPFTERARANQPKRETEELVRRGGDSTGKRVVGWPNLDLFGERALERGDARALLKALGVWAYMADALGDVDGITCDRILREAAGVAMDHRAGNKPLCLGKRLAISFGVTLPASPALKSLTSQGLQSGLGGIAKLRIARMQQQSAQRFHDQESPE